MSKNKSIAILSVLPAIILSAFWSFPATAANLYFGTQVKQINKGNILEVGVLLNTEQESINALEGIITYPSDSLSLKTIDYGNSQVNLWLNKPAAETEGAVAYSGIIPGGFSGKQGYLFTLVFEAIKSGPIKIEASDSKILINDGRGTPAAVSQSPLLLTVTDQDDPQNYKPKADNQAPEVFMPIVAKDPNIFDGRYFIAFDAQDKGSGIKSYEIFEKSGKIYTDYKGFNWQKAESPYLLRDQNLHSNVYIKATDFAGNSRVAVVPASQPLPWYCDYRLLMMTAAFIVLIIFVYLKAVRWRRNK